MALSEQETSQDCRTDWFLNAMQNDDLLRFFDKNNQFLRAGDEI